MPRGATGRRVARAAASGASRSHRGRAPVAWYASLILICVVGASLIGYSKYELSNPATTTTTTTTTPSDSYVGLSFDICGKIAVLPSSTNTIPVGITSVGSGLVQLVPPTSDLGKTIKNATLGTFIADYLPLTKLTSTELQLPGEGQPLWNDGADCTTKPYLGQAGIVQAKVWKFVDSPTGTVEKTNLLGIKLAAGAMITVAFLPQGATIPPAPAGTELLLSESLTPGFTPPTTTTTTVKPGKSATTTTVKPGKATTTTTPGSTTAASSTTTTT
jgi:hypothetical protein